MANISGSNNFPWLGVIIVSSVLIAVCIGIGFSTMDRERRAAAIKVETDEARLGLKVVCLNGVQYWKDDDRDMRSESLAPKYSPGYKYPDICPGHGEKRS